MAKTFPGIRAKGLKRLIMGAKNLKCVFLSGTPMINSPYEAGQLFNLLRGHITKFTFALQSKQNATPWGKVAQVLKNDINLESGNQMVSAGLNNLFGLTIDTQFIEALPTAIMKPLSGSGARGMMVDAMNTHGPNSFIGNLACTLQGSTDTTFYILAVYFGSVGIKNTRNALSANNK